LTTHSATELSVPPWSTALFALGIFVMLGGLVAVIVSREPRWERRLYWATWLIGGALGSASLVPRGLGLATATYVVLIAVAIVWAFFRTNYIKFGDRIIAATPSDRER
jgi:hypothetical protein